jgi:hypothetical protein
MFVFTMSWQRLAVWLIVAALILVPEIGKASARSGSCEGGCQNGGKLLMPNNLFGYCRCRCPSEYKGPKCEFVDKRSSLSPKGADVDDTESAAEVLEVPEVESIHMTESDANAGISSGWHSKQSLAKNYLALRELLNGVRPLNNIDYGVRVPLKNGGHGLRR